MKTSVMLPDDVWEAAKTRAVRERKSLGGVIVDALRAHLGMEKAGRRKAGVDGKAQR